MNTEIIKLLIWVVPLSIFLLFLVFGIIFGLIRGFRKSLILGIHALVIFAGLTIAYAIIVNNPQTDGAIVSITNNFMGAGGLQRQFGVAEENTTFTAIMIELLSKNMNNYGEGVKAVLSENGAYIATLANMALRLVLAIVVMVAYLLLVFIFYLIYLIFYPERRHKAKREKAYAELKTKHPYSKHPLLGMLVGTLRGLASGLIIISFIGSFFFIAVGDSGEKTYDKMDFGNEQMNQYYDIYTGIASYGNNGIFKVLNLLKNKNGLPYYLYATDLVFSSTYEKDGKVINFRTTEEIGSYTGFATKSIDLLIKHGGEELKTLFSDPNKSQDEIVNVVSEIMKKEAFQTEFDKMIDEFEAGHYFADFALALVDSIAAHIDELKIDGDGGELLKILFKKGYLSPKITAEKELLDAGTTVGDKPCLTASHLLSKDDTKGLLKLAIGVISLNIANMQTDKPDVSALLNISEQVLPYLKSLSILNDANRKQEVNPVLQRIYTYVYENQFNNALNSVTGQNSKAESIDKLLSANTTTETDWVFEIQKLLDVGVSVVKLVKNVYDPTKDYKDKNVLIELILNIFEGEHSAENIVEYQNIKNALAESSLADLLLQISSINKMVFGGLKNLSSSIYIPDNIKFVNQGETKGEMYNLLDSFEKMLRNNNFRMEFKAILDSQGQASDISINNLFNLITSLTENDSAGNRIIDSVASSTIVRSVLSGLLIDHKRISSDFELYIPNSVLTEVDGEYVNLIKKDEIVNIVEAVSELSDSILDFINEGEYQYDIDHFIEQTDALAILDSVIIEGSISNILKNKLSGIEQIKLPTDLATSLDGWLSTTVDGELVPGETYHLIHSIKASGFKFSTFTNTSTDVQTKIVEAVQDLDEDELNDLLSSKVIHYTVSNLLSTLNLGSITLIIPNEHRIALTDDSIPYLIKKQEITDFIIASTDLIVGESLSEISPAQVVANFANHKDTMLECDIICATFVNYLCNAEGISTVLYIPTDLLDLAESTTAIYNYTHTSPWHEELGDLITGISEIIDLDTVDLADSDAVKDSALESIKGLNGASDADVEKSKLEICHRSIIIWLTITDMLDESFTDVLSAGRVGILDAIKTSYDEAHLTDPDYLAYTQAEVSAIVDSANVLNLDVTNVAIDDILSEINTFNNPLPAYNNKSTLQVLYGSDIIKCILADKLDEVLTSTVVATDVRDSVAVKDNLTTTVKVYKESEVSVLLDAMSILEITDATNFDADDVKTKILTLNNNFDSTDPSKGTKLDKLYLSVIIVFILKEKLDTALADAGVHQAVIESAYDNHTVLNKKYYKKNEVASIIDTLNYIGITDVTTIDTSSLANTILDEAFDLTKLYESNITIDLLSTNAKSVFDSSATIVDHDSAKFEFGTTGIYFYNMLEFVNMKRMLNHLHIDNFNTFNATNLVIDDDTITYILGSYILMATVSKNVVNNGSMVVPASTLADPTHAYAESSNIISATELEALLTSAKSFGSSIDGFSIDDVVMDNTKVTAIMASTILKATISKNVVDNANIVVAKSVLIDPTAAYSATANYINDTELKNLLDVFVLFGGSATFDATALTPNDVKGDKLVTINKSIIMRVNITRNIKNNDEPIYVDMDDNYAVASVNVADNSSLTILTSTEITNIVAAFVVITNGESFDADLNYTKLLTLTSEDQNTILASNVMVHLLSSIIIDQYSKIRTVEGTVTGATVEPYVMVPATDLPGYPYKFKAATVVNAYSLAGASTSVNRLTADDILACLYVLKTYTPITQYSLVA